MCTKLASFEKDYTGMHGQQNIKKIVFTRIVRFAQRAKIISVSVIDWLRFAVEYLCVFSGFRRGVNEIIALLGCFVSQIGSYRRLGTNAVPS